MGLGISNGFPPGLVKIRVKLLHLSDSTMKVDVAISHHNDLQDCEIGNA